MRVMAMIPICVFVFGCTPPAPTNPTDEMPATPEGACAHLAELGCPEAKTTPDGVSCPMVVRVAGRLADMKLACIAAAPSQDAVRACGTVRCRE